MASVINQVHSDRLIMLN